MWSYIHAMHGERFDLILNPSFSSFRCTQHAWQHVFLDLISNWVCVKHMCKLCQTYVQGREDTISVKFCTDARGRGISSNIWIASVSDSDPCWWEKSEDGQNSSGYPRLEHLYFDRTPNVNYSRKTCSLTILLSPAQEVIRLSNDLTRNCCLLFQLILPRKVKRSWVVYKEEGQMRVV